MTLQPKPPLVDRLQAFIDTAPANYDLTEMRRQLRDAQQRAAGTMRTPPALRSVTRQKTCPTCHGKITGAGATVMRGGRKVTVHDDEDCIYRSDAIVGA